MGLSFELNISNGYCAGGRWIDADHAMQRVACAKLRVTGGKEVSVDLPVINGPEGYVKDIAVLAFPYCHDGRMRHITARYVPQGKGRNGAYDFGKPKWHLLDTLIVPSAYKMLSLVYEYDDGFHEDFNVSEELTIVYDD